MKLIPYLVHSFYICAYHKHCFQQCMGSYDEVCLFSVRLGLWLFVMMLVSFLKNFEFGVFRSYY